MYVTGRRQWLGVSRPYMALVNTHRMLQLVEVHAALRPGDAQLAAEAVDRLPFHSDGRMSRVHDWHSAC